MKIGLIDVDGHNFPNVPLMKISSYHKSRLNGIISIKINDLINCNTINRYKYQRGIDCMDKNDIKDIEIRIDALVKKNEELQESSNVIFDIIKELD